MHKVSEAAVVGYPHDIKGQGIYAYVTLMAGTEPSEELRKELVAWVRKDIGPIASPDQIQFAPGLPKTRSGKIMRRILRKIAEDEPGSLGDTSTLADPAVVDDLVEHRQNKKDASAYRAPAVAASTSPRLRRRGRRDSDPGEGDSPRISLQNCGSSPSPQPLLARAGRGRALPSAATCRTTIRLAPTPHAIVRGSDRRRCRFPASVVFRAFTLFPTFSFYGPVGQPDAGSWKPSG